MEMLRDEDDQMSQGQDSVDSPMMVYMKRMYGKQH